ncbi:MAG TPA: thioredoxin domain-containing protein [Bacteroidia bacterium]
MNKLFIVLFISAAFLFNCCASGQTQNSKTKLSPSEFAQKIKEQPAAPLVDVRTPEEFEKGHLENAKNIDWRNSNFQSQISQLDKSKPVYVYCLSGGRSSAAANQMRSDGFKEVYELDGGIMKWRADNLPEMAGKSAASNGMSRQKFDELVSSDKLVLVDFYADWCEPCKKMKPYLDEISKDMADKVVVARINADDNKSLCKELKVDGLPVLQIYKNKKIAWTHTGFISKEDVLKELK